MYLSGIWGIVSCLRNAEGAERRSRSVLDKDTIAAYSFCLFIETFRELELCCVYNGRVVLMFLEALRVTD